MRYSDEILSRSQERGLTKSERHELREAYLWEQSQDEKARSDIQKTVKDFKDNPDFRPRHRTNCPSFRECQIDFKCMNYNSGYHACHTCVLHETDDICIKSNIHNEKTFNMMIRRERIDLDDK